MKKRFIATFTAIILCMAALCGCSLMKSFERDVQVVLEVDGEYYDACTVNIFNNAIVTPPEVPEKYAGMTFIGWTGQENWEEMNPKEIPISANKGLIRYDDVKDYVRGDEWSVTLHAAFAEIDLVIAWYNRASTSGLNEQYMADFKDHLYAYLETAGYTPEDMYIVIRGYEGQVAASCAQIMADGNVDLMVGWGNNIGSTGGMTKGEDFIENVGGIKIGSVEGRYVTRITDNELTNLVFEWIKSEYTVTVTPDTPSDEPDTTGKTKFVVGWYSKTGTSGLTQEIIDKFEQALLSYLTAQGYNLEEYAIIIRNLGSGNVASVQTAVTSQGDVDIVIGMKVFDLGEGIKAEQQGITMGTESDRRIHRTSDSDLAIAVWSWLVGENNDGWLYSADAKEVGIYIQSEEA